MIWLVLGLVAAAALAPLAAALLAPTAPRGRREADLGLYRAQLTELAAERAAGRLDADEHRAATLEVQRRLLAAPADTTPTPARQGRITAGVALLLIPVIAFGGYAWRGWPEVPSARFADRQRVAGEDDALLATLRERLGSLEPGSEAAIRGWRLLGDAERNRGRLDVAATAYRSALRGGFDPELAGQLVQVLLEAEDVSTAMVVLGDALSLAPRHVGLRFLAGQAEAAAGRPEQARAAWAALIAEAPAEAPWRAMVERRMLALP